MTTVSSFIRYVREQVILNPAVANYELVVSYDDGVEDRHIRDGEFDIDHLHKELILITYNGRLDEVQNNWEDDNEPYEEDA